MKYIRTKDGKIWSFSNPNNNFLYEGSDTKNGKWLHEIGEVFIEADTIEELCDECGDEKQIDDGDKWERAKRLALKGHYCYGAIWTDKGLIYVAKMNEKGEWELV